MKKVRRQIAEVGALATMSPLGIFAWYLPVPLGAMVRRREKGVKGPALSHRTRKGQGTLGSKVAEERLGQPPPTGFQIITIGRVTRPDKIGRLCHLRIAGQTITRQVGCGRS